MGTRSRGTRSNLQPDREYNDQISVSIYNIGGYGGEAGVIGGCDVYCTITRREGQWSAECAGIFKT